MRDRLSLFLSRLKKKLWVKPLAMCALSIVGAFLAKTADHIELGYFVPDITLESVKTLLTVISASMLVMATFAVGSMVAAYASASNTATPRAFPVVIADDVSQNALSAFIGAFIFSIVAQFALQNNYYDRAGRFTLLVLTFITLAFVIVTFLRWVDRIARLGRLGSTIEKVESATAASLARRRRAPHLGGVAVSSHDAHCQAVFCESIGYVQRIDVTSLQKVADELCLRVEVAVLPGTFAAPGRPLAYVTADSGDLANVEQSRIASAFLIGRDRTFEDDPRFGLLVLSEIASRALSPGINDSGSAISVIGSLVRLFSLWSQPTEVKDLAPVNCDRVAVPALIIRDMFDDAFTGIARDGARAVEVVVRLQKCFEALALVGNATTRTAAIEHARMALARAERALELPADLEVAKSAACFAAP